MKAQEIREIIKLVDQSSISEFNFENDSSSMSIKKYTETRSVTDKHPASQVFAVMPAEELPDSPALKQENHFQTDEAEVSVVEITSPMVGTFYRKSSPESPSYVEVGDKVDDNSIVCIVEAMKLFNEIEAEVKGEIVEVLVEDGELVEYGQTLFKVKSM